MSIRKIFFLFLCFCIALIFSACGNGDKSGKGAEKGTGFPAVSQGKDADKTKNDNKKIDVDLTPLSSTMVYSEVYNMITEPDDYLDKTVKMNGSFAVQHDEETGKNYYACIIKDAAACCSQGLEFELSDDYKRTHPHIPWTAVYGLRNRIVHDYGSVDLGIVYSTLKNDIPDLLEEVTREN